MNIESGEFWLQLFCSLVITGGSVGIIGVVVNWYRDRRQRQVDDEFLVTMVEELRSKAVADGWEPWGNDVVAGTNIIVPKFDGVAITKYGERKVRISEPDPSLESSVFTAVATCGKCNAWGVHSMREPKQCGTMEFFEYEFSVVRICNNCGHEWGQK